MPKYRVTFTGSASATVDVETDETDPEVIAELAYQEDFPTVCAQCSGWGRSYSLEIPDEWEVFTEKNVPVITKVEE